MPVEFAATTTPVLCAQSETEQIWKNTIIFKNIPHKQRPNRIKRTERAKQQAFMRKQAATSTKSKIKEEPGGGKEGGGGLARKPATAREIVFMSRLCALPLGVRLQAHPSKRLNSDKGTNWR